MIIDPESGETEERLFVYGTLRPRAAPSGQPSLVHRFVGTATVSGVLYDLGDYPGAILNSHENITEPENDPRILGDVLFVTRSELHRLDQYEGYEPENREESLYFRKRVLARLDDDSLISC